MTIRHGRGDLLRATAQCIVHQVNCMGVMGSGVAKQIRDRWPEVYESYKKLCDLKAIQVGDPSVLLGYADCVKVPTGQVIFSVFGQHNYHRPHTTPRRYTNYEAVYKGLEAVRSYMLARGLASAAFPYRMSCDRGGASWGIIFEMIKDVFKDTDIGIEIIRWDAGLKENELYEIEEYSRKEAVK